MNEPSRREFLGVLGGATAIAVAGCAEPSEGQFVIVNTLYQQHPLSDQDVQVRLELENRRSESQPAQLSVTLTYNPPEGEEQTWTKERDLNVPKGVSKMYTFRFRDVVEGSFNRDHYSVDTTLEEG